MSRARPNTSSIGKIVLVVGLSVLILTSCALPAPNVTPVTELGADEGFLLIRINCNETGGSLWVHRAKLRPYARFKINEESELRVIKISAYDSLFFSMYDAARYPRAIAYFDPWAYFFPIEPGAINYVGDVTLYWKNFTVSFALEDNEQDILREAKSQYPWLFEKYKYVKHIARKKQIVIDRPETVDEGKF